MSRTLLWLLALLALLALPAVSAAEPARGETPAADASVEQARALFQRGAEHARRQEWREAIDLFEQSARARPHPATTFNLAFCERALGHHMRARKLFARALDEDRVQTPGGLSEEARDQTVRYLAEAEQTLARVTIELDDDAAIAVDGRPLELVTSAPLTLSAGTRDPGPPERPAGATFLLLVDPGPHVFLVARQGRPGVSAQHEFKPGESAKLSLKAPAPRAPSSASRPPPSRRPPAEPLRKKPAPSGAASRVPAYAALGVGATGLVVGAVTGIAALELAGELDAVCPTRTRCPGGRTDDVDRLNRLTTISDISFAVAGAGAITGVVLILTKGEANSTSEHGLTLEILASSGNAAVRGRY